MDYLGVLLQIATIVIIVIGGLFLKNYLPSYFTEKGKNLATREDIEEITDKIEKTKTQYIIEVERLKSSLSLASSETARIKEQQWNTLISFFENCSILIHENLPFPRFANPDDDKILHNFLESTLRLFTVIGSSYLRMLVVFPKDHAVLDKATVLIGKITQMRKVFYEHCIPAADKRWERDALIKDGKEGSEEEEKILREMVEEMLKYEDGINPLIDEAIDALIDYMGALRIYLSEQGLAVAEDKITLDQRQTPTSRHRK